MSSLSSQLLNSQLPTKNAFPYLEGSSNISVFMKALHVHLSSNFGIIGQNILNGAKIPIGPQKTLVLPGPAPHYNDERLHPITLAPIPGQRKYIQMPMNAAQQLDPTFDRATLLLTDDSARTLKDDLYAHSKLQLKYETDLEKLRKEDDLCLNFILDHILPTPLEILNSNSLMPNFKLLPHTAIDRADQFIAIITNQFSQGNSTVVIQELIKFLNVTQGTVDKDPTAVFLNRLMDQYNRVSPLLDRATVEELKMMLLCMVTVKGLNRNHPPSLRALLVHLQTYPGNTSLDHFAELRASLLAAQDSDISTLDNDPVSEQSSAFLSATDPTTLNPTLAALTVTSPKPRPPKGVQKPGRKDHCPYCLHHFKYYFYHKESDCTHKKNGITGHSKPSGGTKSTSQPTAHSAALDISHTSGTRYTPQQLTTFMAAQGYELILTPEDPTST